MRELLYDPISYRMRRYGIYHGDNHRNGCVDPVCQTEQRSNGHPFCLTCHNVGTCIPCSECKLLFFCSVHCRDQNKSHNAECKEFFQDIDDPTIENAIHKLFEFISKFPTIKELLKHAKHLDAEEILSFNGTFDCCKRCIVVDMLQKFDIESLRCVTDSKLQHATKNKFLHRKAAEAFDIMKKIPIIQEEFPSEIQTGLLKPLLLRFICIPYVYDEEQRNQTKLTHFPTKP